MRDTRPSSVAVRNYLSYIVVNEYTYTGLSNIFNRFRKEILHLPPIRYGNSGATLLDFHSVGTYTQTWIQDLLPFREDTLAEALRGREKLDSSVAVRNRNSESHENSLFLLTVHVQ